MLDITEIESGFYDGTISLLYRGTQTQWDAMKKPPESESIYDNTNTTYLYDCKYVVYIYSEKEPPLNSDGTAYDGNYWHYNQDGITPEEWKKP